MNLVKTDEEIIHAHITALEHKIDAQAKAIQELVTLFASINDAITPLMTRMEGSPLLKMMGM